MSQPQLNAFDCRFRNGVDIYFSGEQPGDSADPRCCQAEDEYIGWLDDNPNASNEDRLWRMERIVAKHFPEVEDYKVAVLNEQP